MIINRFWFTRLTKGQIKKVVPSHLRYTFHLKLKALKHEKNLPEKLKPLKDMGQATHTLQLGNDRLILKRLRKNAFYILDVENLRGTWEEV